MLKYPADGTLTHEVQNILNCYVFKENLIVARLNNSSIRKSYKILEEIEEFKRVGWDFEKYNIDKTPSQIIKEYYENKGEPLSPQEIQKLEKNYTKNEPEQFLAMYDAIRDNDKNQEK